MANIAQLKKELAGGDLTIKRRNAIIAAIKQQGGKVDASQYPAAHSTETPEGSTASYRNKKGETVAIKPNPTRLDAAAKDTDAALAKATAFGDEQADKYVPEGTFGTIDEGTTPEMQALLNQLQQIAQGAGNLTELEQESINNMRSSLAGFAAPEVQAMREQAQSEIQRNFASQEEAARVAAIRGGAGAGASFAQQQDISQQKQSTLGNLERDLLVENAKEVQKRKETFANLVRSTEDARFGRQQAANVSYGEALSGNEGVNSAKQMFNVNQRTNQALAKAGYASAGAGTYLGTLSGTAATQVADDQFTWMKKKDETDREFLKRMAERQFTQSKAILDATLASNEKIAGV